MAVNIEKMRSDIAQTQRQAEINHRWETRKFVLQATAATGAAMAGGAGLLALVLHALGKI